MGKNLERYRASEAPPPKQRHLHVMKSTRCDGLINEYQNAA
jgi:hypothetical protein